MSNKRAWRRFVQGKRHPAAEDQEGQRRRNSDPPAHRLSLPAASNSSEDPLRAVRYSQLLIEEMPGKKRDAGVGADPLRVPFPPQSFADPARAFDRRDANTVAGNQLSTRHDGVVQSVRYEDGADRPLTPSVQCDMRRRTVTQNCWHCGHRFTTTDECKVHQWTCSKRPTNAWETFAPKRFVWDRDPEEAQTCWVRVAVLRPTGGRSPRCGPR